MKAETCELNNVIKGAYFSDLMMQSDVLADVTKKLAITPLESSIADRLRSGRFRQVVLTGMGSSLHACYPLHRTLSRYGFSSHWVESAELLIGFESLYRKDTLLVVVSQSGESAEIIELASRVDDFGHVIGITNNPNSRLGSSAGTVITMEAGPESTVSCKTYVATLAALHWLGSQWMHGDQSQALCDLEQTELSVREYLERWEHHVYDLKKVLENVTNLFVTGRGDSLATAGTGGLILKESTRQHAEGMSAAAFRHGPLEMAGKDVLVLIFEGDETITSLHRRLADDIRSGGGNAFMIGSKTNGLGVFRIPEVPCGVRQIVEILPVQMVSLALAARERIEAGRFERASKITNIA